MDVTPSSTELSADAQESGASMAVPGCAQAPAEILLPVPNIGVAGGV